MSFLAFCADHGLIVDHVQYGKWVRVPTTDKPRKRNGAYKHLGDVAHVQNHATMSEPSTWFANKDNINKPFVQQIRKQASKNIAVKQKKASDKAAWIIQQCKYEKHAYLDAHGLPDEVGLVWRPQDDQNLLIIPMHVNGAIVGCQMIDRHGGKKFLSGQRCAGAQFVIGSGGIDIWCEGYATGLAVKKCLTGRYALHVCFSAHNLTTLANRGVVIADNDASGAGEAAAKKTGLRYFMPPPGDFCDYWQDAGTFRASQALKSFFKPHCAGGRNV